MRLPPPRRQGQAFTEPTEQVTQPPSRAAAEVRELAPPRVSTSRRVDPVRALDPSAKVDLASPRFGAGEVDPVPATGLRICGRRIIFDGGEHEGTCRLLEHGPEVAHDDGVVRWVVDHGRVRWEVI